MFPCYIEGMTELTLHLPHDLSEKLDRVAAQEAKAPETLVLELLTHLLDEPTPSFIGAWADADITAEDILAARTSGRRASLKVENHPFFGSSQFEKSVDERIDELRAPRYADV